MKQALVLLLIAGGLLGWFAPDFAGDGARRPAAPPPAPAVVARPSAGSPGQALARSDAVVLPRAADGHFYAEVVVGATSTRMLVDTGASVIALTGEDADAIGVRWDPARLQRVARGASGDVYGIRVTLDRVELGALEAHDVEAVVVPEGLEVSLLGQSFLSRLGRVTIDPDAMMLGG